MVSIKDFVRVEKALIDSLGIMKLKAVMGASMGGLQAYEWAQSYRRRGTANHPVIASATAEPFLIAWLDTWAQPIRLDPNGTTATTMTRSRQPRASGSVQDRYLASQQLGVGAQNFGTAPAEDGKDPAKAFSNEFKIESFLDQAAAARAVVSDANHFLYLCKANQLASVDPTKIKVPTLVLYAPNDLIFYEPSLRTRSKRLQALGHQSRAGR